MKNLYKVEIERTTYNGQKSIETREIFAESPKKINTYRLGGFQQDSIKILSAKKIREQYAIEVDCNPERQDLTFSVSLDAHLESTVELNQELTDLVRESEDDESETLEALGYTERVHDNTYNYCSDFDNDMDFKVFTKNPKSDWIYDRDAIVLVREHTGLDARAGYRFKGIYSPLQHDGLCYFLDTHVRLTVAPLCDESGDGDDFDGDGAVYNMLKEYKLESFDSKTQEIIVSKDGEKFNVRWYHPAEGV